MEPFAYALIKGNNSNPDLKGTAYFYKTPTDGIWIEVEINGLPDIDAQNPNGFYGMHIHENGDCTPPFDKTGNHYNPTNEPHPEHAGDLPPLLGNDGYAYTLFYINKLNENDVLNKSLIVHSKPDDFTTQPSGNSGEKIACGVIYSVLPNT